MGLLLGEHAVGEVEPGLGRGSARRRPLAWRVARPCSADQATSARVPSASGNASRMPENARWSGSGVSSAAKASPEGSENIAS